jgi:ABC-type dipeptide/oligopeptide/nickel transport system ATPase component
MIIGLSGYAGSGKDLTAKLIQYCCMKDKDIALEEVTHDSQSFILEMKSNWQIKKFSGPLKKIASILTGISIDKFEDQEFKNTLLGKEWGTVSDNPLNAISPFRDVEFIQLMSVREFLQKLGTDAVRDGLHPNAWVNAAMAGYKPEVFGYDANGSPVMADQNWIFTDCRFPNEAQAIKDRGGVIIRIDRSGVKPVNDHPSETALDNWDFDYKIFNASDIVSLNQSVSIVMEMIKRRRNEE